MGERSNRTRIFILEDVCFGASSLSTIVRGASCEPIAPKPGAILTSTLDSLLPSPELMLVPVCREGQDTLEAVRKRHWLRMVPILGISPADTTGLDLWRLRGLGIVGLIDRRATAEHVRFRIEEVITALASGPRDVRVPCCFLIDLDAQGATSSEYALSFSIGGIGLASARPIEPNTEVRLWLPLTEASGRIEVAGRVVRSLARADGRHDVGIVFLPLSAEVREALAREVQALLLALGLQLGRLHQGSAPGPLEEIAHAAAALA